MDATATLYHQDCIRGMPEQIAPGSVHLVVTSIPFEELFTYSGKTEDVGNNGSTVDPRVGRFALNMRFVVAQLLSALAPGCNACVHIQQLLAYINQHGYMGRRDFRGAMIDVFSAAGFLYAGEFAIQKNPQMMAQRLSLHSLQFKTGYGRDGCLLAPCPNDYVLIFRKPGQHPCPPRPLYHETENPAGWMTTDEWVRDAHGIWVDIEEFDILDGWKSAREPTDERHVCALQLEVIRRLVRLYTNPITVQPDVTVLDPFSGIGSTAWVCLGGETQQGHALESPRNVVGFELKESYHAQSVKNVAKLRRRQKRKAAQKDLLSGVS